MISENPTGSNMSGVAASRHRYRRQLMISQATLDRILEQLETEDRIPFDNGRYTVSHTIYGCSSLSRGGTYYDQVNNNELTKTINDEKLQGIYEHNNYPGVFSIMFNPEKMDERSAEILISFLEDVNMNASSSVPCIDEDAANELEYNDTLDALVSELDDISFHDEKKFPLGFVPDVNIAAELLKIIGSFPGDDPITVEQGPTIYIDRDKLSPYVDKLAYRIQKRQERFDAIVSKLSEWTMQKGHAAYVPDDDDSFFSIEIPIINDRLWVKSELKLDHACAWIEMILSRLTLEKQYDYRAITYPLGFSDNAGDLERIALQIEEALDIARSTAEEFGA